MKTSTLPGKLAIATAMLIFTTAVAMADTISVNDAYQWPITVTVKLSSGVTYTGTTGAAPTNTDILSLVNGGLTNSSGQTINLGATIAGGEVTFGHDNISNISANGATVGFGDVNPNNVVGGLTLGGYLSGAGYYYDFILGYGDETGSLEALATADITGWTGMSIDDLLAATYNSLESQLSSDLQTNLTLDLTDGQIDFSPYFPGIDDPSVSVDTNDPNVAYFGSLEETPEASSAALLAIGLAGLLALARRVNFNARG